MNGIAGYERSAEVTGCRRDGKTFEKSRRVRCSRRLSVHDRLEICWYENSITEERTVDHDTLERYSGSCLYPSQ